MAEQESLLSLRQEDRAMSGGPGLREAEPACPAITDPSFLPCSGQRTAAGSWTAAVPSPEGEPPRSR